MTLEENIKNFPAVSSVPLLLVKTHQRLLVSKILAQEFPDWGYNPSSPRYYHRHLWLNRNHRVEWWNLIKQLFIPVSGWSIETESPKHLVHTVVHDFLDSVLRVPSPVPTCGKGDSVFMGHHTHDYISREYKSGDYGSLNVKCTNISPHYLVDVVHSRPKQQHRGLIAPFQERH